MQATASSIAGSITTPIHGPPASLGIGFAQVIYNTSRMTAGGRIQHCGGYHHNSHSGSPSTSSLPAAPGATICHAAHQHPCHPRHPLRYAHHDVDSGVTSSWGSFSATHWALSPCLVPRQYISTWQRRRHRNSDELYRALTNRMCTSCRSFSWRLVICHSWRQNRSALSSSLSHCNCLGHSCGTGCLLWQFPGTWVAHS